VFVILWFCAFASEWLPFVVICEAYPCFFNFQLYRPIGKLVSTGSTHRNTSQHIAGPRFTDPAKQVFC